MTLAEFIQELANRLDFESDNEEIKNLVMNPELQKINVPDAYIKKTQAQLMTIDEAKTNPEANAYFKKHYISSALQTVDRKINDILGQIEAPENIKSKFQTESNTYDKIEMLTELIKSAPSKNNKVTDTDKEPLLQKINELNEMIEFERQSRDYYYNSINDEWKTRLLEKELNSVFSNYDYAIDVDKDVTIQTARALFDKKLNEKGGKYIYDENGIKLVNKDMPDLPFTLDNKQVELKSFVDGLLAESKLLKINKTQESGQAKFDTNFDNSFSIPSHTPAAKSQTSKALADLRSGS